MRTRRIHSLSLALACVAGCLPTLNPVYTDSDVVFVPELLGTWKERESPATWTFTRGDSRSYQLLYTDKAGQRAPFTAHVARIEGELFLDIFPDKARTPKNAFYQFHVVPIHSIYRLERNGRDFSLFSIDFTWLDEHLGSHADELPFTTVGGRKLITASTAELQAFVVKHRDRFSIPFELERERRDGGTVKIAP